MPILRPEQFQIVAEAGLGHPGATAANAMAWFQDKLYVGTDAPAPKGPDDVARIHCYDPETQAWSTVFKSPVQFLDTKMRKRAAALGSDAEGGRRSPGDLPHRIGRDFGIRSMVVFQGKSDPHPCLYCGTMSIWGGTILRSEDGLDFQSVSEPGMGDDRVLSLHGLTVLDGVLYTAPAGTISNEKIDRNLAPEALVFASDDPASGGWRQVSAPGFDDPLNAGVFAMTAAHGHVYAGTVVPKRGFQLWRTDGTSATDAKPEWERVLTDGAHRFNLNFTAAHMTEFRGDLFIGTGITGFGYDEENDVGPSAAELIRVRADGSWDLLVGQMRFTPDGLKVPLAAMGPGFSNQYNSVVLCMAVHRDTLYLGLHNWEPHAWALGGQADQMQGGFELWASLDGETWEKVLDQGNGKLTSVGIRTICPTPKGLFVGTADDAKLLATQARIHSGYYVGEVQEGFDVLFAAT